MQSELIKLLLILVFGTLISGCRSLFFNPASRSDWQHRIINEAEDIFYKKTKKYSLYLYDIETGFLLTLKPHYMYPSASLIKAPIILSVYYMAQQRKISLNKKIRIRNKFKSIIDGSYYKVPREKSDKFEYITYNKRRKKLPLKIISTDMINTSSNLATNLIIKHVGIKKLNHYFKKFKLKEISLIRGLYDHKAFESGLHNKMSAQSAIKTFYILLNSRLIDPHYKEALISILSNTRHRNRIPDKLPDYIQVAQKSGYTTEVSHDAGIIFTANSSPYLLAIMTKGQRSKARINNAIADLSLFIYQSILEMRKHYYKNKGSFTE